MFIADFHIHSRYSRATSKDCVPEGLELWARRKGIDVIGTGDFTHPAWRAELKEKLVPAGDGLYALKDDFRQEDAAVKGAGADFKPRFVISGEISSIYKKNGRVRKIHNLILLPSLEDAERISRRLEAIGNLRSDGRPILGLDSRDLLEIMLDMCPEAIFIPAHIWTPHFSLYGAYSGFDDIAECFGDLTPHIYALETGLSSDPPMNWRLSALDGFALVSNSDAHSPANLGREANIFDTDISYPAMLRALKNRGAKEFYGTIEFFPEEGKYHYDGHRACKVCWKPAETIAAGGICPVCGGRITVGVLHRVEALADRPEGFVPPAARHFESLVPLQEVIAASTGLSVASAKVKKKYSDLLQTLGPELYVLRTAPLADIELAAGPAIAEGIRRLRCGKVEREPGFDGEYGRIKLMDKAEIDLLFGQLCVIGAESDAEGGAENTGAGSAPDPEAVLGKKNSAAAAGKPAAAAAAFRSAAYPYGLNAAQWEAVSSSGPAVAVIAGPGTGKTKTLVYRIAYLVEKCGVSPSRITAVTFTNKAANEMRVRLEEHFRHAGSKRTAAKAMTIGTFHAICLKFLSQWRGKDNLTVIDEEEAISIIEEILKENNMKAGVSPRNILRAISLRKNGASPAEGGKSLPSGVLDAIYDAYSGRLNQYGAMDYDDLLLEVLRRFEGENSETADQENPFAHLLVDEFQDINAIQYRLIKEWSKKSESIFIIGDPDQAIYGFRGADFRFFARFKEDFPAVRHIRLTQNYRSTPEIIAAAGSLIAAQTMPERGGAHPFSLSAARESGPKVRLAETSDDFAAALFVAKEINRMVGGIDMLEAHKWPSSRLKKPAPNVAGPRGFSDIAVLYRTNRQAEALEQCLAKEGIPYVVAGRDEFLAEPPVREALAFFRFLLNPGDIASLLVCLKAESLDGDIAAKILASYTAGEKSAASLVKIMDGIESPSPLPQEVRGPRHFAAMLQKYGPLVRQEKPEKLIGAWIDDHGLTGTRSMELLLNTAAMHEQMAPFSQNLVLGRDSDVVRRGGKTYSPEAVLLMTLHAAKGLEFPVVFIYGVNAGLIPLSSSPGCDMDEERRLLYVGMTRARDELVLLVSQHAPSPFIADISEAELLRENAVASSRAPGPRPVSLF